VRLPPGNYTRPESAPWTVPKKEVNVILARNIGKLALIGTLGLMALISAGTTLAASGASASGHGTLDNNSRKFSFSARQYADGHVTGQANLINRNFTGANGKSPYQLHIDISCMKTFGNTVYFGGTVKRTNDPSLVDAVFFAVQDNGEPGKGLDKISRVFFWDDDPSTTGDPQACQNNTVGDFPLETIESGNVQVRD
jgi:hypothetical protein